MRKFLLINSAIALLFTSPLAHSYTYENTQVTSGASYGSGFRVGDIATDFQGNQYITGYFTSTQDFDPTTSGIDEYTAISGRDIFLTRYNADGSYAWTRTFGGTENLAAHKIVISGASIYISGQYSGDVTFNPNPAECNTGLYTATTTNEHYITKLRIDGSYAWTYTAGGETIYDITVDNNENLYFSGKSDVNPITKITPSGDIAWEMQWNTSPSANTDINITNLELDSSGNIYIIGSYAGTATDIDPGPGEILINTRKPYGYGYTTYTYGVMMKILPDGTMDWHNIMDESEFTYNVAEMEIVGSNIFLGGHFSGTVDFDPTAGVASHHSDGWGSDVFVAKLGTDGTYSWSWDPDETGYETANDLAVDKQQNNIFLVSYNRSGQNLSYRQANYTHLNGSGTLISRVRIGSDNYRYTSPEGAALDTQGNLYIAGDVNRPDFVYPTVTNFSPTSNHSLEVWYMGSYVSKFAP